MLQLNYLLLLALVHVSHVHFTPLCLAVTLQFRPTVILSHSLNILQIHIVSITLFLQQMPKEEVLDNHHHPLTLNYVRFHYDSWIGSYDQFKESVRDGFTHSANWVSHSILKIHLVISHIILSSKPGSTMIGSQVGLH